MAALEQLLRWRDGKAGALGAGERPRNSSPAGRSAGARPGAGERRAESWRDGRPAGAAYVAVGAGLGWGAGFALGPSLPAAAVATWLVVAGRALGDEARAIAARLADDDLDGARRRLPALVGRDPERLDAKGVARAVVESVAENTVDAVVAPACWAAAVRPGQAREILGAVVRPPVHPSPNAGVVEAAFAAALGLRLGGDTVYAGRVDPRPAFGTGRPPEVPDIDAAVRLSRDVTLALAAFLAAPVVLGTLRRRPHGGAP